ncbi:MAG: 4-hydroxyphenylacetate 3-hydroxylase N-terminal domain-containing protein [Dehalococcoidales bacterium]|nr:4-hydroxyphenylacetate 3-hydroxylase N-terminal domain-containing protein [Dehalococcoidales bacterium]
MRTGEQYRKGLAKLKDNVYMNGKLVSRDDPVQEGAVNVMAATFDYALDPEFKGIGTAKSHLTGETVNRFTHIHHSMEDLLNKQKMTRLFSQELGGCVARCMGIDATNALSVVTYEADQKYGTEYNKRFLNWLKRVQKEDVACVCGQTDVKGNRPWRPHQQKDPSLYVRVIEKTKDGIIVEGAKAHNSFSSCVDEDIIIPTRHLTDEDKDWAVAFSVPADAEGMTLINAAFSPPKRKKLQAPYSKMGATHSITVFDKCFVPWERVFMCGEPEFAGKLALLFALFHRHSYTGCKAALSEIMLGATALAADYNGIANAQHVRHKLADMISVVELIYAAGIAAGVNHTVAPSGTYVPDTNYCNVGRMLAGESIYEEYMDLAAIAGGLSATLPPEADFENPKTKDMLNRYIMRNPDVSTEDTHRAFRLFQDIMASHWGGHKLIDALHGGGSPVIEKVGIYRDFNLDHSKNIAKRLAGIKTDANDPKGELNRLTHAFI